MKKIYLIGLLLLLTSLTVTSAPVTLRQAQDFAMQFLTKARQGKGLHAPTAAKGLSLAYTGQTVGGTTSLYAFNCGKGEGFVIVAGDDRVPEVLGYADHGTYDTTNMPENMRWWIGQWEAQMEYLATHPGLTMSKPRKATKVVEPLLGDIAWDQGSPYNIYCPYISYYDEDEEQEVSGRAPTGCVATALAQVMYFWKYPAASTGSISYTTATAKKDVCADLNTSYDWSVMVPKCTKQDEDTTKHAIAKLMFNIGAAAVFIPETSLNALFKLLCDLCQFLFAARALHRKRDVAVVLALQGLVGIAAAARQKQSCRECCCQNRLKPDFHFCVLLFF